MTQAHTYFVYEEELHGLHEHMRQMSEAVQNMLTQSLSVLIRRDRRLAETTIAYDHVVNRMEVDNDEICLTLLARRQPVASDLRFITASLKLVTDLERIGDLCVNICERARELEGRPNSDVEAELVEVGAHVGGMLERAMKAFLAGDARAAERVLKEDAWVDASYAQIFQALIDRLRQAEDGVQDATRLQSVAKCLERIGDHATNIAETVIFMVTGQDVRHPGRLAP